VFRLEPLAQDPREIEITDVRYVNLFTPLSLPRAAPTEARTYLVVNTLLWLSEVFTLQKFGSGLVARFSFGVYSGKAKGSEKVKM
jgi:hypothetical protein